jgi:hypothetical protein
MCVCSRTFLSTKLEKEEGALKVMAPTYRVTVMVLQSNGDGVRVTVIVLESDGHCATELRLWCHRVTVMVLLRGVH